MNKKASKTLFSFKTLRSKDEWWEESVFFVWNSETLILKARIESFLNLIIKIF